MGSRWKYVCSAICEANENFGGEDKLASLLGAGMKRSIADGECDLIEGLICALSKVYWLKEQYLPRPDPIGDMWKVAKRQALAN